MQREDIQSTSIVMLGLAAATLTGFFRQVILAFQLGSSRTADIYLIAFTLPEFVFVALPIVLIPAFLPPFIACRKQAGEATAIKMGMWVTGALVLLLSLFTLVVGLGAPVYMPWLAHGFNAVERARAIQAGRMMLPAIDLMGLAIIGGAILQAYRRFGRPAFTTSAYNITFIAALLALPVIPLEARAAWGVTLGAVAAFVLQWPVWHSFLSPLSVDANDRKKIDFHSTWMWTERVLRLAGPLGLGYTVHHFILLFDRAMATTLGVGSVAALDYALRLAQFVGQLGGLAVSTVLFPNLIEHLESKNLAGARRSLADALYLVWMITLPACLGLIVLRTPLVRVLFEHGAFDQGDTIMVSQVLAFYALAVLADAVCQPLWRVIYAQHRVWTVLKVNGMQTGIRVLGNLVLIQSFGYNGIAISAIVGLSVQAFVLGYLVFRQPGFRIFAIERKKIVYVTIVSIFCAGLTYIAYILLNGYNSVLTLLISGMVGTIIYILTLLSSKYLKR